MSITLNKATVHPSWQAVLAEALDTLNPDYLQELNQSTWLPGPDKIFNAFSQPREAVKMILFGESPYPRVESANGYAFWDNQVTALWSATGLAKAVNRATSLRNFIKMLLVARGDLKSDTSQPAIAAVNKTNLIQTLPELFNQLIGQGFLLLNTSLVLSDRTVKYNARAWQPFMQRITQDLCQKQSITCLLFGKIAEDIKPWLPSHCQSLIAEHPYNISFIHNPEILDFFRSFNLLEKNHGF